MDAMYASQAAENPLPEILEARCDGCGLCLRACPNGVLALAAGKAVVARPDACDYSALCAQVCPRQAILLRYEIRSA